MFKIERKKNNMGNVRWESPFPYSLAFNLFKQHFEEINRSYWAFVPAANTIKALAKKSLTDNNADPKKFFMIPDEEDRRMAPTYGEWKMDFSEYENYSRLNVVMLLSSCFETYMRTVVSLAFESKPGAIINCRDDVDGAALLKKDIMYGNVNDKTYRFGAAVDEVCHGEWTKRFAALQKYFGKLPLELLDLTQSLDELRITRNNLGHYFGREKDVYTAPIDFEPRKTTRISHKRILKYFKIIHSAAKMIEDYLYRNIIGSYDIIKKYFCSLSEGEILTDPYNPDAYQLRKLLGRHDLTRVGKEYYNELVTYCKTNYIEKETDCIFTKKMCIKEINRKLKESNIKLLYNGQIVSFDSGAFKRLLIKDNLYDADVYSERKIGNNHQVQYLYSAALINYMTKKLESNASSIIEKLKEDNTRVKLHSVSYLATDHIGV